MVEMNAFLGQVAKLVTSSSKPRKYGPHSACSMESQRMLFAGKTEFGFWPLRLPGAN
jgi:hypothetical protein